MADNPIDQWDQHNSGYKVKNDDGGTTARVDVEAVAPSASGKSGETTRVRMGMIDTQGGKSDEVQGFVEIETRDKDGHLIADKSFGVRVDAPSEFNKGGISADISAKGAASGQFSHTGKDALYVKIDDPALMKVVAGKLHELAAHGRNLSVDDAATLANLAADLQDDGKLNKSVPDVRNSVPELKGKGR